MARVLGASKAGVYAWLRRPLSAHAMADAALLERIKATHSASRQTYGSPRVHAALRADGEKHSRKPTELTFYLTHAPEGTMLAELVRIAGTRWHVESLFEQPKGEVGLGHYG